MLFKKNRHVVVVATQAKGSSTVTSLGEVGHALSRQERWLQDQETSTFNMAFLCK